MAFTVFLPETFPVGFQDKFSSLETCQRNSRFSS